MAQFKVGDKVKIVDGRLGIIKSMEHGVLVDLGGGYSFSTIVELLELVEPSKTADEMFAELGYENFHSYDLRQIVGYRKTTQSTQYDVVFMVETEDCFTVSAFEDEATFMVIDMPLHKAIHKKLEELGWL